MPLPDIDFVPGESAGSLTARLFGPLGDEFGRSVEAPLPPAGLTVGELRRALAALLGPGGEKLLSPAIRICVDRVIASEGARVWPGQEVAVLPVFSGG